MEITVTTPEATIIEEGETMPKKRKCRLTPEEIEVHDLAVKLRKMTDRQLVTAFREATQNAPLTQQDSPHGSDSSDTSNYVGGVRRLLEGLSEGKCKGIGSGTVNKLTEYAKEVGLI